MPHLRAARTPSIDPRQPHSTPPQHDQRMNRKAKRADPQTVSCEVCLKRVPRGKAAMDETAERTAYFCSPGCYERWRGRRSSRPPPRG